MRGRPRNKTAECPPHIDISKLPRYCYWDKSGNGHWYTVFKDGGKSRRKKIGDAKSKLSELHQAIERKTEDHYYTLVWLHKKFSKSPQYLKNVGDSQRDGWEYAYSVLNKHGTKKKGVMLSGIPLDDWNPQLVQKVVDSVGQNNGPTTAKRVKEYLRRIFNWGAARGHCPPNPVGSPEMPPERKQQRLPEMELVKRLEAFARARGSQARRKGTCSPYIWIALVIARKCRLRGAEVFTATDANLLEEGIDCQRKKGSRANITEYDELLEEAIDAAITHRTGIHEKKSKAIPFKPEDRILLVGTEGQMIKKATWQSAWRRFLSLAIEEGAMSEEQRFGLHDLKRRGITDTPGTKAEKMEASGHKSVEMLEVYDKSKPIVAPSPG